MAKLSANDVLKLARLARLDLTEAEVAEYADELSEILQYVEMLNSVDVTGLKPTNQVNGLNHVTRQDEIVDYGYPIADLMANVPETLGNQIKVKRMLG